MEILILFLFAHALCDYPLQGDFIGKFKNPNSDNPFPKEAHPWWILLFMHCLIHAGAVYLISGLIVLFFIEFVFHFIIDSLKNYNKINFKQDQALHLICKLVYLPIIL